MFPRKGEVLRDLCNSYFVVCVDLMENGDQTFHMCNEILHLCFSLNKALCLESNSLNVLKSAECVAALEGLVMWRCISPHPCTHAHTHTHTDTHAHTHAHRHTCSRSHITHPHMHACAWPCTRAHTDTVTCAHMHTFTHTNSHMHTHPYACMHIHTYAHTHTQCAYLCTHAQTASHRHIHMCAHTLTHVHTQMPTLTRVPIGTHTYINLHRLPRPRACTHTCAHTHTPAHTVPVAAYSASATTKERDVSESLLTLLPLLRPCSRPDRDVVRRGRPAPGQYLELQSLALLHVSSC